MNQKSRSRETVAEDKMEEQVADYLKEHPDFLNRHGDVFAVLDVDHQQAGRSVSLIERQVGVLRQREQHQEARIREMIDAARQNEALGQRLHHLAVTLIQERDLSHQLADFINRIVEGDKLDAVSVLVAEELPSAPAEIRLDQEKNDEYRDVVNRVAHGASVCDDRLPRRLLDYLFGDDTTVQSVAVVPLVISGQRPFGVVVLGATDVERFHPEMGTHYLDRLGQLLAAALRRHDAA